MAVVVRTVRKLIESSYRKLGVFATGETIDSDNMNDGLIAFQDMLAEWAADGMLVPALVQESFALVAGQPVYTIGEDAADFTTARPDQIVTAFIRDGLNDYPVQLIAERAYSSLQDKNNGGSRPDYLYYNPTAPNGTIKLYRVPSAGLTLFISSLKAFPDGAALLSDVFLDIGIPRHFNNPLIYNLAIELAPEHGVGANELTVIAGRADSGKSRIRSLNAAARIQPAVCEFARGRNSNMDLVGW